MTKLDLEIFDDVITVLNKIRNINDEGIELDIPEGSVLFENILNLKLLQKRAEDLGKVVHFKTLDEAGLNLISIVTEGNLAENTASPINTTAESNTYPTKRFKGISLPSIKLPKALPKINLPSFGGKLPPVWPVIGVTLAVLLLIGGVIYAQNAPKAKIKVVVNSLPLTKSVQIKVRKDASSDATAKILRGVIIQAENAEESTIATTGTKTEGKKAKGVVKVYNKTTSEVTLKKAVKLKYKDFTFVLDEEIAIPAATENIIDPTQPNIPGEKQANVTAGEIGKDYNIDKGKTLEVNSYKTADVVATSTEDFEGGESKTIKVVAEKDITDLSSQTLTKSQTNSAEALADKLSSSQKLITGSTTSTLVKEEFTPKVGEEADTLKITQVVSASGLVYVTSELNTLLDGLVKDLIPDGYILSSKERDVKVDILGNSDTTVLSTTEADLQVTLKTYIIPDIKEDTIKDELRGKSTGDAQKYLGSIKNVKTYELNINPTIPFFQRIPTKTENIEVEISVND
ncbi:MAG: hypothetical protein ACD_22C00081G0003 [uncultured bacterium]|nr:MAG: hypothetical protein ACD_22C00081G0003 [uncultured bacterium]